MSPLPPQTPEQRDAEYRDHVTAAKRDDDHVVAFLAIANRLDRLGDILQASPPSPPAGQGVSYPAPASSPLIETPIGLIDPAYVVHIEENRYADARPGDPSHMRLVLATGGEHQFDMPEDDAKVLISSIMRARLHLALQARS